MCEYNISFITLHKEMQNMFFQMQCIQDQRNVAVFAALYGSVSVLIYGVLIPLYGA
jgi:hypothetical protein